MIGIAEGFLATVIVAFSIHHADFNEMVAERYKQGHWWKFKPEFVEEERIAIPFNSEHGRYVLFQIGE
jgi:hypothetical protein|tara:strand:- start:7 stop:210 length:204 start_codon:yes stop_codon:yes gene_type:complete